MIYSEEAGPRPTVSITSTVFDRLYNVLNNLDGQEYLCFRSKLPGVVGSERVLLWSPQNSKSFYYDGTVTPAVVPDIVIFDDVPDGDKLVMEQGDPAP